MKWRKRRPSTSRSYAENMRRAAIMASRAVMILAVAAGQEVLGYVRGVEGQTVIIEDLHTGQTIGIYLDEIEAYCV